MNNMDNTMNTMIFNQMNPFMNPFNFNNNMMYPMNIMHNQNLMNPMENLNIENNYPEGIYFEQKKIYDIIYEKINCKINDQKNEKKEYNNNSIFINFYGLILAINLNNKFYVKRLFIICLMKF